MHRLYWLKVRERILYKNVSLAYKLLPITASQHLFKLIAIQQPGKTRSTKLVSLDRPATSRCKLSNRLFQCADLKFGIRCLLLFAAVLQATELLCHLLSFISS